VRIPPPAGRCSCLAAGRAPSGSRSCTARASCSLSFRSHMRTWKPRARPSLPTGSAQLRTRASPRRRRRGKGSAGSERRLQSASRGRASARGGHGAATVSGKLCAASRMPHKRARWMRRRRSRSPGSSRTRIWRLRTQWTPLHCCPSPSPRRGAATLASMPSYICPLLASARRGWPHWQHVLARRAQRRRAGARHCNL
jgi:hypothetical protein